MNNPDPAIRTLLAASEPAGSPQEYVWGDKRPPVAVSSNGGDVYVVSDLHIGSGLRRDGTYTGTENFFADQSFQRFIRHVTKLSSTAGKSALLVVNGDMIDFLRIVRVPRGNADFELWQKALARIGMDMTIDALRASIGKRDKMYGLKTDDFKSVWKLEAAAEGHPTFFSTLAEWIGAGHRLIVTKGNHDLEFFWKPVRDCFRLMVGEQLAAASSRSVADALEHDVLPRLQFIDHALMIDGTMYIEHGHRFDKFSHVLGTPVLKDTNELNIPFGSFFNRYLVNTIEMAFPFIDNVRPRESLLPLLFRERFFLGLRVLFQHVPFMLKMIPKKYFRYMLRRVFWYALVIGVPAIVIGFHLWNAYGPMLMGMFSSLSTTATESTAAKALDFVGGKLGGVIESLGLAGLSYLSTRLVGYFQLAEPDSLDANGRELLRKMPNTTIVTMGHTHFPDQIIYDKRWFYNTGTWIPMVELETLAINDARTYTFLVVHPDGAGHFTSPGLQHWNDSACRIEPLLMVRAKGTVEPV